MLTQLRHQLKISTGNKVYTSDKLAISFLVLAMSYLLLGTAFGLIGGFQYILPNFLKEALAFQKVRPLHVYLVITWIFTAAQGSIYYFLPRITNRNLYSIQAGWLHFFLQLCVSTAIVVCFFAGKFGGREYLEFPPVFGFFIALSWVPFAVNFFRTLRPRYINAPVYYFSFTAGIVFFFITLSESYLWLIDHFNSQPVRDITVQWKALGSMVGSWNMLIYGCSIYLMEQLKGEQKISRSPMVYFFFFLGFVNLMFNWGHHTYIVPASPTVKTVAYVISMTELLLLGQIIFNFRKTLSAAMKQYHILPFRFLSFADGWIFLNLTLAIVISIPAVNYFTHGTHITVAHAMGATIGINTMLLFASVFYIISKHKGSQLLKNRKWITNGASLTNLSLIIFWVSLIGSGLVKIAGRANNDSFYQIMNNSAPLFKIFAYSGVFILVGLTMIIIGALKTIASPAAHRMSPSPITVTISK